MANTNEYIVFEADQVLTNDHLNEMFGYLDQQNRWTRNKLIGIGIVCGFNLAHHTGIIEITKGCGVTSQGYLILKDAGMYAYIMPYAAPEQPADLPFTYPGNLPFYQPFCTGKDIFLLLTDDEYNDLEDNKKPQAKTLSSQKSGFLNDYVVVLFLEATETDLKNCSAFDCTNKGGKMQFNVRPLLVAKKDLPVIAKKAETLDKERARFTEVEIEKEKTRLSHEIMFKRYNVPYTLLKSSTDVLNGFTKIVDDTTLQEVANAYMFCFEKYSSLLTQTSNPFAGLYKILKEHRDAILKEYPIFIQYFYDFVDDLILAYYEFCTKVTGIISQCCPNENLFPLHLVLGDASKDTTAFVHDAWRNYFIYSPLFTKGNSERNEAQFYFTKMLLLVKDFFVVKQSTGRIPTPIKITPSQYGYLWLSQRAIPYYYRVITGEQAIYNYWNYYKSSHGNSVFNLSYNANLYNHAKPAVQPLLYDIEHYNFFRIEGHIGEKYTTVLNNILHQRLEYNLPFDVVAISADMLRSNAKLPVCNMQDIETDYKLIVSEFACKVHTPFCFLTKFPYPPTTEKFAGSVNDATSLDKFSVYRAKAMAHFSTLSDTLQSSKYAVGDFMRKYCLPENQNTIGGYYLNSLKEESRLFGSEVTGINSTSEQNALSVIYDSIFAFIDAVEKLMLVLMTSTAATLDTSLLERRYTAYTTSLSRLTLILTMLISSEQLKLSAAVKDLELDMLIDEFFILSTVCIDERLQTLVDEYLRRLKLFQQQNTFINYYKKHPGLEHKAGVPKGGTFVLVYYSAEDQIRTSFTAEEIAVANRNTDAEKAILLKKEVSSLQEISNSEERILRMFVDNCKDASTDDKTKVIDIIDRINRPPVQTFKFTDGEVIADFYVPYMCCSDCPPIAYILPEKENPAPPVETPAIKMDTTFCEADNKPSPITVSPVGGKITDTGGNEVPGIDNTAFTFTPRLAGAGEYKLIYTVNGVSSGPVTITVLEMPKDSVFDVDSEPKDGFFNAHFNPDVTETKFTYDWKFGDGFTPTASSDVQPVIKALSATGATINTFASLQISNGICKAELFTLDLVITPNGVFKASNGAAEINTGVAGTDKKIAVQPSAERAGEKLNEVLKAAKKNDKKK